MKTNFILYVSDQTRSTAFYSEVLGVQPTLNVPGMTEFTLLENCVLGVMPEKGIKRLLGEKLPDPEQASGIPRAEVYLTVENPEVFHRRALSAGARELSPVAERNWGDRAGYSIDIDGHVLAFAAPTKSQRPQVRVHEVSESDKVWVASLKEKYFSGADFIVSRGRKIYPTQIPGLFAESATGERLGYLGYEVVGDSCEVVTLDAFEKYRGIGTALLNNLFEKARAEGWKRLWLLTTNDNLDALRFYQKRGFAVAAVHAGAVERSRALKPTIPLVGSFAIPIRDEIELEIRLSR